MNGEVRVRIYNSLTPRGYYPILSYPMPILFLLLSLDKSDMIKTNYYKRERQEGEGEENSVINVTVTHSRTDPNRNLDTNPDTL